MLSSSPAVRRKFYELYRLPAPANSTAPLSRTSSPTTSPAKNASPVANGHHSMHSDPFTLMVLETIKLIQSALALWGMFGNTRHDLEVDGLFCDETKAGIFQWRRVMGMEHEESMRLEVGQTVGRADPQKETSGGCIDPKTLAALLSSVTSVRYQLAALGIERVCAGRD